MEFLEVAVKAAKTAGEVLHEGFAPYVDVKAKGQHDVVSEFDYKAEDVVKRVIRSSFLDHTIVAEKSGRLEGVSSYSWYIDPLDGTSNFLLGIPYFSTSIALIHEGKVVLGVVYNPVMKELYRAEVGKGAFLNDHPVHVSQQKKIGYAMIASAYASDAVNIKRGLHTIERLALLSRKVVINFSPALDLCNIARGKLDALVDNGTTPEDHAAGSLIVTEAGGEVRNYEKGTWNVDEVGIIATNGRLQNTVSNLVL